MGAHNHIVSSALDVLGPMLFQTTDSGEGQCPICSLDIHHREKCTDAGCTYSYDIWIEKSVVKMFERAVSLGLVPQA